MFLRTRLGALRLHEVKRLPSSRPKVKEHRHHGEQEIAAASAWRSRFGRAAREQPGAAKETAARR